MSKKIAIWDGCANGGMMDSLSLGIYEESHGVPGWIVEVSDSKWEEWKAFLEAYGDWDSFWDSKLTKDNRNPERR